ncbi:MAG: 2Fe-2S iron-sulfur cluster-binding protein [Spongiibacteraceae bacterium]
MPIFQLKVQHPVTEISVHSQQTLLTQCQSAGLAVASSCRNGNCGRCFAQLLNGQVLSAHGDKTVAPATIALCTSLATSNVEFSQLPIESSASHWYCQALSPQLLRLPAGQQPGLYTGNQLALLLEERIIVSSILQRSGRELSLTTPLPTGVTSLTIVKISAHYKGSHTLYVAADQLSETRPIWSNINLATAAITLAALQRHGRRKTYTVVNHEPI